MSESLNKIDQFKRQTLSDLLDQCTEPQQNLFERMYGDVSTMETSKIDWAIQQCERTIEKNNSLKGETKTVGEL